MKDKKIEVMIVWAQSKSSLEGGTIHVLDSFEGPRVYEKNKVDPRLTLGMFSNLPFADNWADASKFMYDNPGKQLQITTQLGKKLGLFKQTNYNFPN